MERLSNKQALKQELLSILERDLEAVERSHRATREGATHEEARPENDKDTRALEQSYLARGQAMRVEELASGLADLRALPVRDFKSSDPIALGALVTVVEGETQHAYFVVPAGAGVRLASDRVQAITLRSPLGRALLGKRQGDDVSVPAAGRTREMEILEVH